MYMTVGILHYKVAQDYGLSTLGSPRACFGDAAAHTPWRTAGMFGFMLVEDKRGEDRVGVVRCGWAKGYRKAQALGTIVDEEIPRGRRMEWRIEGATCQ